MLGKPQHHRLDRRDVYDARARADEEAIADVDQGKRLRGYADGSDAKARKEERRSYYGRKAYVALDDLAEERSAHAQEEYPERKGELHLLLRAAYIGGNLRGEVGECVDLAYGNRQHESRQDSSNESFHGMYDTKYCVPMQVDTQYQAPSCAACLRSMRTQSESR